MPGLNSNYIPPGPRQAPRLELMAAEAERVEQMMESPAGKYAVPAFFTPLSCEWSSIPSQRSVSRSGNSLLTISRPFPPFPVSYWSISCSSWTAPSTSPTTTCRTSNNTQCLVIVHWSAEVLAPGILCGECQVFRCEGRLLFYEAIYIITIITIIMIIIIIISLLWKPNWYNKGSSIV